MNAIVMEHLTKEYKDVIAVQDLNINIPEGIMFTLLGVNGAGKTTTIKMLAGLCKPTSGNACILGKHIVQDHEQLKSIIALSPQETAVAPNLSVKENLELMAGVHGFSKEKTVRRVHEMMEQFSLENIQHKRAKKLSGGWMRRLSIAMALIS